MRVYDDDNDNDNDGGWIRATAWKGSGPRTYYSLSGGDRTPLARREEPQARTLEDERAYQARVEGLTARVLGIPAVGAAARYGNASFLTHAILGDRKPGIARGPNVFRLGHTRSEYPSLLEDVSGKVLVRGGLLDSTSEATLAKTVNLPDFKTSKVAYRGSFPALTKVGEAASIPEGTLREQTSETWKLDTYASRFTLSEQALVNDDVGAFADMSEAMAQAVAGNRESVLWTFLRSGSGSNGPTLADTGQLFNATAVTTAGGHANLLGSGSAPSVTALGTMVALLSAQRSLGGAPLNLAPRYLVGGPSTKTALSQVARDAGEQMRLEVVSTPYITDNSWYVFADPARHPLVLRGLLNGVPMIEARPSWEKMGIEFRVSDFYAAAVGDWRAAVKNPGA